MAKYGVIAQEVEKEELENLVSVNGETGLKSVDYATFFPNCYLWERLWNEKYSFILKNI